MQWDPLEHKLTGSVLTAATRRQIQNILKSYTGWFDPFSELIQNALDAIEKRVNKGFGGKPSIWIQIDLESNKLSVTDNGIAFQEDQFRSFLAPSVSFKKQENRGNKGVGATYLAYGFNNLEIGTRSPDYEYLGVLKNGREWVEDEDNIQARPQIKGRDIPTHTPFEGVDRGTTFTLTFEGNYIRPSDLSWMSANKADQWGSILRIKTPLGGVYGKYTDRFDNFECHISVIDKNGIETQTTINNCTYLYPHKVIKSCKSLDEIREVQEKRLKRGKDASKLPQRFYKLNGLYKTWTYKDFTEDDSMLSDRLSEEDNRLMEQYKVEAYAFFCYSTDIWDHFNDKVLKIRKGKRVLRGGVQLATNSMPQGTLKIIPLQRNIGYQNTSHVVVHFEQADPDLGRKGFQPELENLGKEVSRILVNQFMSYRQLLKSETGAPPDITAEKEVREWIDAQKKHEEENGLFIKRSDVFLPIKRAAMTSKPLNEQDTVSLFNQMLAGGVVRGVQLMAASTHKQYDGVCKLVVDDPVANHEYNIATNPLGVPSDQGQTFVSNPKIVEYKYNFDALMSEFTKDVKNERDIGLVVAWDMGTKWKEKYDVTSLLDLNNRHHRYFHGATHIINSPRSGQQVFPVIILSELIDYINEPHAVQDYHEEQYADY